MLRLSYFGRPMFLELLLFSRLFTTRDKLNYDFVRIITNSEEIIAKFNRFFD